MPPRKNPWFRFYVETLWDQEIRSLPPAHRWLWVAVLGLARSSPVAGALLTEKTGQAVTEPVLADAAALPVGQVKKGLQFFLDAGMLRRDDEGALVVVNWDKRQFESDDVTARTQRHRERSQEPPLERSNGTGTERSPTESSEVQRSTQVSSSTHAGWAKSAEDDDEKFSQVIDELVRLKTAKVQVRSSKSGLERTTRRNALAEHGPALRHLLEEFPGAPSSLLAAALMGEKSPNLSHYRRSA